MRPRAKGGNHQPVQNGCVVCAGRPTAGLTQLKRISVQKRYQKRLDDSLMRCSCLATEGVRNSTDACRGLVNRPPSIELCGQGTSFMLCEYHAAALCNLAQQEAFPLGPMASSSPSACQFHIFAFWAVK